MGDLAELERMLPEGYAEFCNAIEALVSAHIGLTTGHCDLEMYEGAQRRLRLAIALALAEKDQQEPPSK